MKFGSQFFLIISAFVFVREYAVSMSTPLG